MEFTEYKCPVCNEQFKSDDDVVVCPECGAPHHRDCYIKIDHCFYEDKHSDDFSFEELNGDKEENSENSDEDFVTCPKCKYENEKTKFYCDKCGYPLNEKDRKNNYYQNNQQGRQPNNNGTQFNQGTPPFGAPVINAFDPLAGLNSEQEIADNVKVGEMAKFVGKTTQYYLTVFNRIKTSNNSKFNFAAFLFSGIYFLYRKMTGIGIVITLLIIALTVGETYIQLMPEFQELYYSFYEAYANATSIYSSMSVMSEFTMQELLLLYIPFFLTVIKGVLMLICGFTANRTYYKHCTKKIKAIKKKSDGVNISKELESNGGINFPIAICFAIAYMIITYIPIFI